MNTNRLIGGSEKTANIKSNREEEDELILQQIFIMLNGYSNSIR